MRGVLTILVICMISVQPAYAGAWMREVGTGFTSILATLRELNGTRQVESSLYGEYGLTPYLTLGTDMHEVSGLGGGNISGSAIGNVGHVLVFLRTPLGPTTGRTKVALELALGGSHLGTQWRGMGKTTLSVGRGFTSRWGDGWFNVDTALEMHRGTPDPIFKLDAVIGLSSGYRVRPLLQLETTYLPDTPLIWSVTPGIMIDARNKKTTWLVGLERKTAGKSALGLKVGFWRKF